MPPSSSRPCAKFVTRSAFSALRDFSTVPANQARKVPPMSPDYIRLNLPKQVDDKKHPRVRGFLPVPRKIFPRTNAKRMVSAEYLQQAVARPTTRQPRTKEQREKTLLAESRRRNLNEGMTELWSRETQERKLRNIRSTRNHERNHAMATAPEREDDAYTLGTTLPTLLDTKVYEDPRKFRRADRRRDKNITLMNAKKDARKDALMDLYVTASNFMTNESELRAKVEELFSEDYMRKLRETKSKSEDVDNAWGVFGAPPSLNAMLGANTGVSHEQAGHRAQNLTVRRQKRIAEAFTGGQMDDVNEEDRKL